MNLATIATQTEVDSQSAFGLFSLRLTWTVIQFAWQGIIIAIALATVLHLLRMKSANARYLASVAALAMLITFPVVTFWLSATYVENLTNGQTNLPVANEFLHGAPTLNPITPEQTANDHEAARTNCGDESGYRTSYGSAVVEQLLKSLSGIVTLIYLSGLLVMSFRLIRDVYSTHCLIANSTFVSDPKIYQITRKICDEWSIRLVPLIAQTREIASPVVVRTLRPLILLPTSVITGLTAEQIEAVLAHELAHIRRWDMIFFFAQRVVETLLFFHPAVGFVIQRMNTERELACDEMALSLGWKPVEYCEALVRAAEACATPLGPATSVMGMSISGNDPSEFKQRIVALLGDKSSASSNRISGFGGVLAVSGMLILTSIFFTQSDTNPASVALPIVQNPTFRSEQMGIETEPTAPEPFTTDLVEHFNMDFVHQVLIEGNSTIPTAEIAKHIQCSPGNALTENEVKDDVDALVKTRWFSSVEPKFRASDRGINLIFHVRERPIVKQVEYKGAHNVKAHVLESLIQLRPGSPLDVASNRECASRITEFYRDKGYLFASVELETGSNPHDRDVIFDIREGCKVFASSVMLRAGREMLPENVADTDLRHRVVELTCRSASPAESETHIELIKRFYHRLGYFDAEVRRLTPPDVNSPQKDLLLEIQEGVRYKIREIEIVGHFRISETEIRPHLNVLRGEFFNSAEIRHDTEEIKSLYERKGCLLTQVEPIPRWHQEQGVVDLVFRIAEPFDTNDD